ncbi:hypothetical protein EB241_16575 [Erwinia psidii]|uniref:Uncharacterized protein n=1 Tax=Erwinia psidii TaxID=69224 RepID=A0A3N6SI77_9GAMM|nr:hypothetical protein EB241_16575 [Erwinia psidii]
MLWCLLNACGPGWGKTSTAHYLWTARPGFRADPQNEKFFPGEGKIGFLQLNVPRLGRPVEFLYPPN